MSDTTETETETETNTDNTDEPTKAELHDRVEKLESTVAKMMPSRRDALRMGAAGIAGAAGLSATTQPADASTGSAGTIGSNSDRPDLFADDIDANSLSGSVKNQGCRVFLSADQTISAGSQVKIEFDNTVYDSDNNFDASTHRWVCPQDGLYAVTLAVRFIGGSEPEGRKVIIGGGATSNPAGKGTRLRNETAEKFDIIQASSINQYQSGDSIAGYARNDSSADTLSSGNTNFGTFMEVAFLGGL